MDISVALFMALLAGCGLYLLWHEGVLQTRLAWLIAWALLLAAFGGRLLCFDYETLDYQNFLAHWAAFFRQYGGFLAMKRQVGNYNIPYLYFLALFSYLPVNDLYLIKALSSLFDLLLAWAVLRLVDRFTPSATRRFCAFFTTLFLPTVFLNSAVWGQCDSIYVALLLHGLDAALRQRPRLSVVLAALAFGFKLQAVFVLPVWAVLWMSGRVRERDLLYFPLTYVLLVLPAVLLGRPFLETITLYFSQTGTIGSGLNYNSPSIFAIFWHIENQQAASIIAILAAALFTLNMLGVAWVQRKRLSDQAVLALALLFAIGIPFLLPHMHERYFYPADILALTVAFAFPLLSPVALLTQYASLLGYHAYLKMRYLHPMRYGSAALIVSFALGLICFLQGLDTGNRKQHT